MTDEAEPDLFVPLAGRKTSPHAGHRERLRERALNGGLPSMPDYELLELMLFRTMARGDTKPLAKRLVDRFKTVGGVLKASVEELAAVPGVGEAAATDFKLLHEAALRLGREPIERRPVISSHTALLSYLRTALQHEGREQFRVLFLDTKNQLIADEVMNHGTVDHAPVYVREITRRAFELSAVSMILVHNHPSGDPTPSSADIEITRQIVAAGAPFKLKVHDHLIVGRHGVASLKSQGLM